MLPLWWMHASLSSAFTNAGCMDVDCRSQSYYFQFFKIFSAIQIFVWRCAWLHVTWTDSLALRNALHIVINFSLFRQRWSDEPFFCRKYAQMSLQFSVELAPKGLQATRCTLPDTFVENGSMKAWWSSAHLSLPFSFSLSLCRPSELWHIAATKSPI